VLYSAKSDLKDRDKANFTEVVSKSDKSIEKLIRVIKKLKAT